MGINVRDNFSSIRVASGSEDLDLQKSEREETSFTLVKNFKSQLQNSLDILSQGHENVDDTHNDGNSNSSSSDMRMDLVNLLLELMSKITNQQISQMPKNISIQQTAILSFFDGVKSFLSDLATNLTKQLEANKDSYQSSLYNAAGKISSSLTGAMSSIAKSAYITNKSATDPHFRADNSAGYHFLETASNMGRVAESSTEVTGAELRKTSEDRKSIQEAFLQEIENLKTVITKVADSVRDGGNTFDKAIKENMDKALEMAEQIFRLIYNN
jgi:hypothetical protein